MSTNKPSEKTNNVETQAGVPNTEKPNAFKETFGRIGNGMKEFGKSIFGVVKEVAKIPVALIKGADSLISNIPIAGQVYGAGKEVVKGVWGITEQLPVVGSVFEGLRVGAHEVAGAVGFASEAKSSILDKQAEFLLGQKKDFIDREKIQKIIADNPELQSHFDEYFKNIEDMKTGKETMSVADLIKDGENLKKEISEELAKRKGEKKGEVFQSEYIDFQRSFPSSPDFSTLQKNSPQYTLLQNMYFGRDPKPNFQDPIVKEFIQKSLDFSLNPNNETYKAKQSFALTNAEKIAEGFAMSPLERSVMNREINIIEKQKREPPTMPHEHSGDDYGLGEDFMNANKILSSRNSTDIDASVDGYTGVLLNIFEGGGH